MNISPENTPGEDNVAPPGEKVPLTSSRRAAVPGSRVVGHADPSERLVITLTIRPKQPGDGSTLTSPEYRGGRPLSGERFTELFGASESDLLKATDFAKA